MFPPYKSRFAPLKSKTLPHPPFPNMKTSIKHHVKDIGYVVFHSIADMCKCKIPPHPLNQSSSPHPVLQAHHSIGLSSSLIPYESHSSSTRFGCCLEPGQEDKTGGNKSFYRLFRGKASINSSEAIASPLPNIS